MATPFLDFWTSRGVYIDTSFIWNYLRSYSDFFSQTHFWISIYGFLRNRNWFYGMGGLGSPHVCFRYRTNFGSCFFPFNDVYCCSNWCENFKLDGNNVGRKIIIQYPNVVCYRRCFNVYSWRSFRCNTRSCTCRYSTN